MAHPMVGFQYASESAPSVVARPSERNALGYLVPLHSDYDSLNVGVG